MELYMVQALDYDDLEIIGVFKDKREAEKIKEKLVNYEKDIVSVVTLPLLESADDLDINFIYELSLLYYPDSDRYLLNKTSTNKIILSGKEFKNYNCYKQCRVYFQNADYTPTELEIYTESKKSFLNAYQKAKDLIKEQRTKHPHLFLSAGVSN